MKFGLLWYDNSANSIAQKIEGAAKRYREKFGVTPDTCFINPSDVDANAPATHQGITIGTKQTIMPNHLWLGVSRTEPTFRCVHCDETFTTQLDADYHALYLCAKRPLDGAA